MGAQKSQLNRILSVICIAILLCVITLAAISGVYTPSEQAEAVTDYSKTTEIGEITLANYDTRTDDNVFDQNKLQELYDALLGTSNNTLATVTNTLATSGNLNSSNFRTNNPSKKDVIVKINGIRWIACYLSTNRDSEPILTLWLSNTNEVANAYRTCQWATYNTNSKGTYPAALYDTTKLRAVGLNNGGKYASGNGADQLNQTATQDPNSPYAIYTMPNSTEAGKEVSGSLIKYIDKPANVAWQETEQYKDYGGNQNYECDAYSNTIYGYGPSATNRSDWLNTCSEYGKWKNDYLWIPGIAEIGYTNGAIGKGMWAPSNELYNNAIDYFLRSPSQSSGRWEYIHNQAGAGLSSTSSLGIRPAFHLNLAKATSDSQYTLTDPSDVRDKIYDGNDRDITDASWYKALVYNDVNAMQIEYLNEAETSSVTPHVAGKYKVRFTILNNKNYKWTTDPEAGKDYKEIVFEILPKEIEYTLVNNADGIPVLDSWDTTALIGTDTANWSVNYTARGETTPAYNSTVLPKRVGLYTATVLIDNTNYKPKAPGLENFELEVRKIPIPTISPSATRDYASSEWTFVFGFTFNGINYRSDIKLERPTRFTDADYTLNSDHTVAYATKAGNYAVSLELEDPVNTEWVDGKGTGKLELPFTINPVELKFNMVDGDEIPCTVNTTQSVEIEVLKAPKGDDTVVIDLIATYNGGLETTLYEGWELNAVDDGDSVFLDLDIGKLIVEGKWDVQMILRSGVEDNANYLLEKEFVLDVQLEVDDGNDTWRIRVGRSNIGNAFKATGGTTQVTFPDAVTYDGRTYEIYLKPSSALDRVVDENYNDGDYVKGYKTELISGDMTNVALGKYAGTYKTSVMLKDSSSNTYVYSITWEIGKAKFDLTNVKWAYDGKVPFSTNPADMKIEIDSKTLKEGLAVKRITGVTTGTEVGGGKNAIVEFEFDSNYPIYAINYILPVKGQTDTYTYKASGDLTDFEWDKEWEIVKLKLDLDWTVEDVTDVNGEKYQRQTLSDDKNVVEYEYYLWDTSTNQPTGSALTESDIEVEENIAKYYVTKAVIKSAYQNSVEFNGANEYSQPFQVGVSAIAVEVSLVNNTLTYNGNSQQVKLRINGALSESNFDIVYYDKNGATPLSGAPSNAGEYRVEVSLKSSVEGFYLTGDNVTDGVAIMEYEIKPISIDGSDDNWTDVRKPPSLQINKKQLAGIRYEYQDSDGNPVAFASLKAGNTYKIRAVITDRTNYAFEDGSYETEWKEFTVNASEVISDPSDPNAYPDEPGEENNNPSSGNVTDSGDNGGNGIGSIDFDNVGKFLQDWWQVIASAISIILIIIFLGKTIGYASRRKEAQKTADKYKTSFFAASGTGLFGLAMTSWTAIACVLMGLAVVSLVIMIITKNKCKKAEREAADGKDEYTKMMFMHMMGGQVNGMGQNGYVFQQGLGAEEIRGIVSDTMMAMLPGVQQALPQQASTNDDVIKSLIDGQNAIMQKLSEQRSDRVVVEREVASAGMVGVVGVANSNDETIKKLVEGQDLIMQCLAELTKEKNEEPKEKIVEKIVEVPVEVEKIVEKEVKVEVPVEVEKIVEKEVIKEVPVEVEKIVEVEVPVEKIVEVEKEVIKEVKVEVPVAAPPKPKKEVAPKLTLDEAYAALSKEQKKYFDGLKAYALSKDKCKEKKSTYFTVFGQTSTNPILKLTIKKDTTVALLKMEDEFMKDLRRDASGDGTKVKVKETEIVISDAQAFDTAKKMIDLREDQIERYNDLLKEQRSVRSKK